MEGNITWQDTESQTLPGMKYLIQGTKLKVFPAQGTHNCTFLHDVHCSECRYHHFPKFLYQSHIPYRRGGNGCDSTISKSYDNRHFYHFEVTAVYFWLFSTHHISLVYVNGERMVSLLLKAGYLGQASSIIISGLWPRY